MSRKRLDSGNEVELGVGVFQSSPKASRASSKSKTSLKERYQSIGLIAMVICFIIIGFQMTTNDAYSTKLDNNVITVNKAIDTPAPTNHQIEVMIHEDDGDVEVDVPDQLPPDLNPNQLTNPQQINNNLKSQTAPQLQGGTTLTIRRTQTNNNDSSSLSIYPHSYSQLIRI